MQKSFSNTSMVCHVWAQQTQTEGWHSNHGHKQAYFEERELFSYGSHYLVGRIMSDGAALINADKNSKTTNGIVSEAWSACSHRKRYSLPGLTRAADDFAGMESKHSDKSDRARYAKRIRTYCHDNALELSADAGAYLLKLAKVRNPAKAFAALVSQVEREKEKEKQQEAKSTRRDNLEYAARVSKLTKSETALVQGLANVIAGPDYKVKEQADQLRLAHRAAKQAKRDRQAADVWRVLQLVRAEIKLRERQEARKAENRGLRIAITDIRERLSKVERGAEITAHDATQIAWQADRLIPLSRVKRAAPALTVLSHGFAQVGETLQAMERAAREAKERERLAAWLRGEGSARGFYSYSGVTLLRAVRVERDETGKITGGELQTSRGAEVPLPHAVRAFRFLKLCHDNGRAWERNGHSVRVGHFTVDRVEASGDFTAGCHHITWGEVERVARELGVFTETASDEALTPSNAAA